MCFQCMILVRETYELQMKWCLILTHLVMLWFMVSFDAYVVKP
jgi:hypothetical protein